MDTTTEGRLAALEARAARQDRRFDKLLSAVDLLADAHRDASRHATGSISPALVSESIGRARGDT